MLATGETAEKVDESGERAEPGIAYAIARLQQRILAGVTEHVAPYGLTTLQYTTLSVLNRQGSPLSTSQLAQACLT